MPTPFPKAASVLIKAALVAAGAAGLCLSFAVWSAGKPTGATAPTPTATNATLHAVRIRPPGRSPSVLTGLTNHHGQPVTASCGSCHASTRSNPETRAASELDEFHQGLTYAHGNLTCLSCHNAQNYDTLRMADSRAVRFDEVIRLCSQCHGPQRRDYDRGLHGGMNGYWDLTRGGRTRNTCVHCHDPHAPAFPQVLPVLPPRDRISVPSPRGATPTAH